MKKLLVLLFVAAICIPSYGSILVYKTTTTATEFGITAPGTGPTKVTEKGYLVIDVDLTTQIVASAQQITYGGTPPTQQAKIADVVFYNLTAPGYIVADYLCGDKDAILSGKAKLTEVNLPAKQLVATPLKGSMLVYNAVLGSGSMTATLDTKLTKANVSKAIADAVGDIQDSLEGKYGAPVADTTPPEPNVMTWATGGEPNANGSNTTITMTAHTATDANSPPVEYYFTNVTDPNLSSAWQDSATFVNTGLTPSTTYKYNVMARDSAAPARNVTAASTPDVNATTAATDDNTPPEPNVMTWAAGPNALSDSTITMTATTATDIQGPVEYYFTNVTRSDLNDVNHNSGWQTGTNWTDTGLTANTNYKYNVKARDKALHPNVTAASTPDANDMTFADTSAPTPDPMTWATEPTATGSTTITMKATTASDTSGPVQYEFWRTTGTTAIVRAYSIDPCFVATGLTENTVYGYKVRAKDTLGNATGFSASKSAQTGKTIQTQINEALALRTGSAPITVTIAAGTYFGDIAVNDSNVTLVSASGDANTIIQLEGGVGIDIQGGASRFILDGFTIEPNAAGGTTFAIQLANAPKDVNIANNIIDVNATTASMAISVGVAGAENLTIINNHIFIGSNDGGIWGPDVNHVSVLNNTIHGPAAHLTLGYGVEFAGIIGTSLINGNTLTNCGSGIFIMPAAGGGGTKIAENVTISDNTVSQCQKGIVLGHTTATAEMNDIYVYGNTLQNNVTGLYVALHATLIDANHFGVYDNSFTGSVTSGIENTDTDILPAELNWWGDASGPYHTTNLAGLGDTVLGVVDFDPWYITSAMDANSAG